MQHQLSRHKRFIGLLIAGIAALVTLIAAATASAISLSTSIQTADFVNELSYNVSHALATQEDWDRKIEQHVNALYDVVQIIGEEVVSLETRVSLRCHSSFQYICVTPYKYNSTRYNWSQIQNHLNGIWHDTNTSLNLQKLYLEIKAILNNPGLDINIAKKAKHFIQNLKLQFPTLQQLSTHLIYFGILAIGGVLLALFLIVSCRFMMTQFIQLLVTVKKVQLHQKRNKKYIHL